MPKKTTPRRRKSTGEKHQPQRHTVKAAAKKFRTGNVAERQEASRILNDKKNDPLPPARLRKRTTKRTVTRTRKRVSRR